MPVKSDTLDILPLNLFICDIKYSFSNSYLASFNDKGRNFDSKILINNNEFYISNYFLDENENYTTIEVKDEGIGINQKHFDRLFERFYRVDESRSRDIGGTGLGLAIVKHIILLHNGTIDVQSKEGVGTTFLIKIKKQI